MRGKAVLEQGDYLELASSSGPPVRFPLGKARVQIGRSSDSDILLPGAYVSRRHARLERSRDQEWRIIDFGSANGTFVNGRKTDVAALGNGDIIGIGTHRLVLHLNSADHTLLASRQEIVPAAAASVVIDRAALEASRVIPARLLNDLHEASRRLSRAPDIPSLLACISDEFRPLLHPKRIAVGREDGPRCQWPIVLDGSGQPTDGSDLTRRLVPKVQALESSIAISLKELEAREAQPEETFLFPIKAGERRLGHVYVELPESAPPPGDETIQFLSLLARQAALVWENFELAAARATAEELNREMYAARQIQLRLFPSRLDLDPALDIAAENHPALTISGDYYDCQLLEPGRVLFIIADVMGHGLPAALVMAGVQAVFRTGVRAGWSLIELDRRIHDAVAASGEGETFVSGILGLCDMAEHRLTLLAAGHPWPSILCGGVPVGRDEQAYAVLWGVPLERSPRPAALGLPAADWSIVAYTDGIPETAGADGTEYGAKRLGEVHRQHQHRAAKELCNGIVDDVLRFSDDSTPQDDDMTLLVLRSHIGP